MAWVWVILFSVLGTGGEHGTIGAYSSRMECEQALLKLKLDYETKGKPLVGSCSVTQKKI